MKEKYKLLERVDDALKDESTSQKNIDLLIELKTELVKANSKEEYIAVIYKLADILGAMANLGAIAQLLASSV
jgi:hypothetical protein